MNPPVASGMVISPYDLTSPGPAARVALLLADDSVTLAPLAPPAGAKNPRHGLAATISLLERWEWTGPLWREGALGEGDGDGPDADLEPVRARIDTDPDLSALRELIDQRTARTGRAERAHARMTPDELCRDVLRGGAEPEAAVVVSAAVERYAARTGRVLVRGEPRSLATMLEAREGREVVRFSAPLIGGDGEVIARARELLHAPLQSVREALRTEVAVAGEAFGAGVSTAPAPAVTLVDSSRRLNAALSEYKRVLWSIADETGCSRALGLASVSISLAEQGTALRAAARVAARSLGGVQTQPAHATAKPSARPHRAGLGAQGGQRQHSARAGLARTGDVRMMAVLTARPLPWQV